MAIIIGTDADESGKTAICLRCDDGHTDREE
jgi:hypothetical protein